MGERLFIMTGSVSFSPLVRLGFSPMDGYVWILNTLSQSGFPQANERGECATAVSPSSHDSVSKSPELVCRSRRVPLPSTPPSSSSVVWMLTWTAGCGLITSTMPTSRWTPRLSVEPPSSDGPL